MLPRRGLGDYWETEWPDPPVEVIEPQWQSLPDGSTFDALSGEWWSPSGQFLGYYDPNDQPDTGGGDWGLPTSDFWDNGDGSFTDPKTGYVWENGSVIGTEYLDGTGRWRDNDGYVYNWAGDIIGYDHGEGIRTNPDAAGAWVQLSGGEWVDTKSGEVRDAEGNFVGYQSGDVNSYALRTDGFYQAPNGVIYDALHNAVGYEGHGTGATGVDPKPAGGGFWSGVKDFFGGLLGGGKSGTAGGGGGGGGGSFGGGGSGGGSSSSQQQQRANQTAQELARAQANGASAAQIAALQRRLATDLTAAQATDWTPILIAGGVAAALYAVHSRRDD